MFACGFCGIAEKQLKKRQDATSKKGLVRFFPDYASSEIICLTLRHIQQLPGSNSLEVMRSQGYDLSKCCTRCYLVFVDYYRKLAEMINSGNHHYTHETRASHNESPYTVIYAAPSFARLLWGLDSRLCKPAFSAHRQHMKFLCRLLHLTFI